MVKGIKEIWKILNSNFAGWLTNKKIYLVLLLLAIFVLDNFSPVFVFASQVRYRVTPYLFPFCFTHPFMRIVIFSCVIFLFADAPFMSELQLLFLARTGRRKWYISQIIYLGICSFLLTSFMALLPVLRYITRIAFTNNWGRVVRTLAVQTDILHPILYATVNHHSQRTAMVYTVVVCMLLILLLGMILYICNISFKNKDVGIFITAFLVLFDWFVYISGSKILLWVSPISWIQISNMAYARELGLPSISFAVTVLIIANSVLILLAYMISKRKDIVNI